MREYKRNKWEKVEEWIILEIGKQLERNRGGRITGEEEFFG